MTGYSAAKFEALVLASSSGGALNGAGIPTVCVTARGFGSSRLLARTSPPKRTVPTTRKYDKIGIRKDWLQLASGRGWSYGATASGDLCCRSQMRRIRSGHGSRCIRWLYHRLLPLAAPAFAGGRPRQNEAL